MRMAAKLINLIILLHCLQFTNQGNPETLQVVRTSLEKCQNSVFSLFMFLKEIDSYFTQNPQETSTLEPTSIYSTTEDSTSELSTSQTNETSDIDTSTAPNPSTEPSSNVPLESTLTTISEITANSPLHELSTESFSTSTIDDIRNRTFAPLEAGTDRIVTFDSGARPIDISSTLSSTQASTTSRNLSIPLFNSTVSIDIKTTIEYSNEGNISTVGSTMVQNNYENSSELYANESSPTQNENEITSHTDSYYTTEESLQNNTIPVATTIIDTVYTSMHTTTDASQTNDDSISGLSTLQSNSEVSTSEGTSQTNESGSIITSEETVSTDSSTYFSTTQLRDDVASVDNSTTTVSNIFPLTSQSNEDISSEENTQTNATHTTILTLENETTVSSHPSSSVDFTDTFSLDDNSTIEGNTSAILSTPSSTIKFNNEISSTNEFKQTSEASNDPTGEGNQPTISTIASSTFQFNNEGISNEEKSQTNEPAETFTNEENATTNIVTSSSNIKKSDQDSSIEATDKLGTEEISTIGSSDSNEATIPLNEVIGTVIIETATPSSITNLITSTDYTTENINSSFSSDDAVSTLIQTTVTESTEDNLSKVRRSANLDSVTSKENTITTSEEFKSTSASPSEQAETEEFTLQSMLISSQSERTTLLGEVLDPGLINSITTTPSSQVRNSQLRENANLVEGKFREAKQNVSKESSVGRVARETHYVKQQWTDLTLNVLHSIYIGLEYINTDIYNLNFSQALDENSEKLQYLVEKAKIDPWLVDVNRIRLMAVQSTDILTRINITSNNLDEENQETETAAKQIGTTAAISTVSALLLLVIVGLVCIFVKPFKYNVMWWKKNYTGSIRVTGRAMSRCSSLSSGIELDNASYIKNDDRLDSLSSLQMYERNPMPRVTREQSFQNRLNSGHSSEPPTLQLSNDHLVDRRSSSNRLSHI